MSRRMEVRCCCEPGKLLGRLELPELAVGPHLMKNVTLRPSPAYGEPSPQPITFEVCAISLRGFDPARRYRALKKPHEVTIETLRRIPGFEEARKCGICGEALGVEALPETKDCGGDCVRCMATCGDPQAMAEMRRINATAREAWARRVEP